MTNETLFVVGAVATIGLGRMGTAYIQYRLCKRIKALKEKIIEEKAVYYFSHMDPRLRAILPSYKEKINNRIQEVNELIREPTISELILKHIFRIKL